jgi:lipopolysaccharide heptosyltransferase II
MIMKNILVFNVNWVGDVIFSLPVFKALREAHPQARIVCLAVPRVRELLLCCPNIDEVMLYEERAGHRSLWGKGRLIQTLKRRRFHKAFLLHGSLTRALLIYLAGIPERIGFSGKGRDRFLTHAVPLPGEEELLHRSDRYLRVVEGGGIPVRDRMCVLRPCARAVEEIIGLLADQGIAPDQPFVVMHTGGNWDPKRWPRPFFAALIQRMILELRIPVVIPGTKDDQRDAQRVGHLSGVDPVILAGRTSLVQLAALMARARCVVSADSGPMHIASAVGTPGVGIFGPTRPEITAPRGPGRFVILQKDVGCNRAPCYYLDCPRNVCMLAVGVDEVFETVRSVCEMR